MVKHNDEEWTLPRRKPITKEVLDRAIRAEEDAEARELAERIKMRLTSEVDESATKT